MGHEERACHPSVVRHFERIYNIPETKTMFDMAEYPVKVTPHKDKRVSNLANLEPQP
jgi:hypothetical protein